MCERDRHTDRQTDRLTDRQTEKHRQRQAGRQTERQTDRQRQRLHRTNIQTDREHKLGLVSQFHDFTCFKPLMSRKTINSLCVFRHN